MKHIGLIAALALVACTPLEAAREAPVLPVVVEVTPAPPPPLPPVPDSCRSDELRYLVGRHKNEIPVPIEPGKRRVTCTTCPVTMDYSPERLNILYDQATGMIKEVKCG